MVLNYKVLSSKYQESHIIHFSPNMKLSVCSVVAVSISIASGALITKKQTPLEHNPYGTPNLILNGNFLDGAQGWRTDFSNHVQSGTLCVTVSANNSNNFLQTTRIFNETKNDVYYLNFTAYSSRPVNLWLQTQGIDPSAGGAPVDPNLNTTECPLTTTAYSFTFPYSPANQGNNASLSFRLAGNYPQTEICIASVSLRRINRHPFNQDKGPAVKVNQLGCLPNGPKIASLFTGNESAADWQLRDSAGSIVATGKSTPQGHDTDSGMNFHTIDFSSYSEVGTEYMLTTTDGTTSYPFSISPNLYQSLRQDSMQFFYQQRSGIAITADLVDSQHVRAAGHVGISPNQVSNINAIIHKAK